MALLAMFALLIFNTPLNPDPAIADLGDDYFEDFEGSVFPAWEATGFWHIEDNDSSSWPLYNIPSDSHYAWYGNSTSGNYDTGEYWNSGDLTSDSINLTKLTIPSIELGFWSWAKTENLEGVDEKKILVSPDDGSTWEQLGIIPDSDYEWQYWRFDITEYRDSQNFKVRFSFDTVDEIANDFRGWMLDDITIDLPEPRFDLFIMQEFHAYVGEIRSIDFLAKSYFGYQMEANISIIMETPSGIEVLYGPIFNTISEYGAWANNVQYEFKEPGTYIVIFILTDDSGTEWVVDCWWEIEDKPQDEFILRIEQDNYAGITDNRKMGFFIHSYFDISVNANISIIMETPSENITLFHEPYNMIEASGYWEEWFDFTFTETGVHFVHFIVIDEYGYEWVVICPWEIDSDFFDLWIDQDSHAGVTDWGKMNFHTKSYYDHGLDINISIDIITPSGPIENLYSQDFVYVNAFGYWDYSLDYQFTELGSYTVIFSIVDEYGMGWARECPWYIESDFLGICIEQDMDAIVGDTRSMRFHIKNYFDHGMTVDVKAEINTPEGITDLLIEDSVWINAYNSWNGTVEYTFTATGEYKVFFLVIDENNDELVVDCLWKVHEPEEPVEKEHFELKIDCDRSVNIGDKETMEFMVTSYFNHAMDVKINATIETPDGVVEILFTEMVWIDAYGAWANSYDYEFKEVGEYKVVMVLVDDIGTEWAEKEFIDSEPETTESTSEESSPPTIGVTPGFEGFLIIGTTVCLAIFYRKRHA